MKTPNVLSAQIEFEQKDGVTEFVLNCFDRLGKLVESKKYSSYTEAENGFFDWLNSYKGD